MRYSLAPLALAAFVAATPVPQGVTEDLPADGATPSGCQTSYDGTFNIQIVNISDSNTKRSIHKRQSQILALSLADGKLTDSQGRTGYIAANSQFQFDAPPQTGATVTSGWSVCSNGHLTLGSDDEFESCLSGNFYNLYDENVLDTEQCVPVYINVVGGSGASSSGAASVQPDGQPTGSAVEQIPDGQITGSAVAQIPDGQITGSPVEQIPDGQITGSPVEQIPDGQITGSPVAPSPTSAVANQISDGQVQVTSAVSPTSAVANQISDGQVQVTSAVSAAPTGVMPSANGTSGYASPSVPVQQTGAASAIQLSSGLSLFAAIFGVVML